MFCKGTFKSKSFYAGIIAVMVGIFLFIQQENEIGIQLILAGVAIITGRDAFEKLINKYH